MAATGGLAERIFYAICVGTSGSVVVSVVSFALGLPLLATLGSPETVIAIFSTLFGVPAFWFLSRRPGATVSRRAVYAGLAGLFGLVAGVFALIAILIAGVALPLGTAGWALFVVGVVVMVGVPTYVLVERGGIR